ncbi:curved DNA-binding protein [Trichodelitschia bisporula]|uniref:Curved DNA-binding protein n=1 Tax=Trichodelitschia bisporula TaxID=703511 RepID=A0A6G1I240_9PEZI|nr:curved DNA-binding protein [Trichodelitschia bisporula]
MASEEVQVDYTLANPDTLTKYKQAGAISQKVLEAVKELCTDGAKIVEICEKGDKLLEDEIAKVYKGKKITKGIAHPTTVSPSSYVTPYTPLKTDADEAETTIKNGEIVKIQLGAQIDGLGTIVCDSIVVGGEITGRAADLLLATHYANELLLRLLLPPGTLATTEEEKKKAESQKPPSQGKINQLLEVVAKSYDTTLVESTTSWLFERNEIEGKKKIILAPGEGVKGEGVPEVGDVWGIETGLSLGGGKVKTVSNRATLHRRTTTTYILKRPSSRATLSEIVKKFGTFPFSLRQLEDERAAKVGVVECVSRNVLRQYEVVADKEGEPVSRLFTTVVQAITKNGVVRLAGPPTLDLEKVKSDKKITDEDVLKILELPLAKTSTKSASKNKKKKKKPAKKAAETTEEEESDE